MAWFAVASITRIQKKKIEELLILRKQKKKIKVKAISLKTLFSKGQSTLT